MENQAYCVTFNFMRIDTPEYFLTSDIILNAKSKSEALGEALNRYDLKYNVRLIEWKIASFDMIDRNREYEDQMKLQSFLELIKFSGPRILDHALRLIADEKKIAAIKYIRDFLKPYLSLVDCKHVIEQWTAQNESSYLRTKTPLFTMVNEILKDK